MISGFDEFDKCHLSIFCVEAHDGLVVIHGRLFAQWLHHAYPQECPMPPSMGLRLRQELPKDFTLRTGQDYVATEKEMKRFAKVDVKNDQSDCELPWTFDEELLESDTDSDTDFNSWIPVALATLATLATSAMAVAVAGYAWKRQVSAHSARGPLLQTEAHPAHPADPAPAPAPVV